MLGLKERLKIQYYRLKYRTGNGSSMAYYIADDRKREAFDEWLTCLAKEIKPCSRSLAEVRRYMTEKYEAREVEMSEASLRMFKASIILNCSPDILETSEIPFKRNGKMPTRKEALEHNENHRKRFEEALVYPAERLDLKACCYEFDHVLKSSGVRVTFEFKMEDTSGMLLGQTKRLEWNAAKGGHEEEMREINAVLRDIVLYRGVTAEDIEKKTPWFRSYAYILAETQNVGK